MLLSAMWSLQQLTCNFYKKIIFKCISYYFVYDQSTLGALVALNVLHRVITTMCFFDWPKWSQISQMTNVCHL